MTKVAVLWKQLAGYTSACFRALQSAGAEVHLVHRRATPEAPYDDADLAQGIDAWSWSERPTTNEISEMLERVQPDIILVSSWEITPYRRAVRRWSARATRVLCMDNPWRGTLKQWGGRIIAPRYLRPAFDLAFVPGERQAVFARTLGFSPEAIRWGLYTCSGDYFVERDEVEAGAGFLYVGRLVESKGISTLLASYRRYAQSVDDPWPLTVVGTGPLAPVLEGAASGIEVVGFVDPSELPAVLRSAGCLILPSHFEPWGVVIHEAAASGRPVICSDACGASTRLVLDGFNGRVVPAGHQEALADAMVALSGMSDVELKRLGVASRSLADQLTPERWAAYVLERM